MMCGPQQNVRCWRCLWITTDTPSNWSPASSRTSFENWRTWPLFAASTPFLVSDGWIRLSSTPSWSTLTLLRCVFSKKIVHLLVACMHFIVVLVMLSAGAGIRRHPGRRTCTANYDSLQRRCNVITRWYRARILRKLDLDWSDGSKTGSLVDLSTEVRMQGMLTTWDELCAGNHLPAHSDLP